MWWLGRKQLSSAIATISSAGSRSSNSAAAGIRIIVSSLSAAGIILGAVWTMGSSLSTRNELSEIQREMRLDNANLKKEVKTELSELKKELRTDLSEMRKDNVNLKKEVKTELSELKKELKTDLSEVKKRIQDGTVRIHFSTPASPHNPTLHLHYTTTTINNTLTTFHRYWCALFELEHFTCSEGEKLKTDHTTSLRDYLPHKTRDQCGGGLQVSRSPAEWKGEEKPQKAHDLQAKFIYGTEY
ncbi:hypothetical protein EMCRGX_G006651 [Ephydatia muelleri]